jgi:hypothetical protein
VFDKEETPIEYLAQIARKVGVLSERNRILVLLVQYKKVGWLDDAIVVLLSQDIMNEGKEN